MKRNEFTYTLKAGFQKANIADLATLEGAGVAPLREPPANVPLRPSILVDDIQMEWIFKAVPMWWDVKITIDAAPDGDLVALRRVTYRFGAAHELEGWLDPVKAKSNLNAEITHSFQEAWQKWKGMSDVGSR